MIKVELFYKVNMYDSDWMMTEAEYEEFRKEANNLPVYFTGPKIKDESRKEPGVMLLKSEAEYIPIKEIETLNEKYQEVSSKVDDLAICIMENVEGEPSQNEGAIDTAIRLLKERAKEIFLPKTEPEAVVSKSIGAGLIEKEPEIVRPSPFYTIVGIEEETSPEIVCENGACRLVLEEEEPEVESYENLTDSEDKSEERKKPGRKTNRDFSKYIGMYGAGGSKRDIVQQIVKDWAVTESTANNYYFTKVKPEGELKQAEEKDRANEKEKKKLADHLEKKIQVIPPTVYNKPDNGKCFSDEDRENLQKKFGLK